MVASAPLLVRLATLNVDRATGDPAPHKPLLLLALLDLIEAGRIVLPTIALSAEITEQFLSYWRIVAHRRRASPDVRMPFHHLSGDGICQPLNWQLGPSADRRTTWYSRFTGDVSALLQDPGFRNEARRVLVATYFQSAEQVALAAMLGIPEAELDVAARTIDPLVREAAVACGRDVKFRTVVLAAYGYACALSRHRLTTISKGALVDAAHIHQFADSRNDDPKNGMALSKNAHWAFDQGLWTVADDHTVLVASSQFSEDCPGAVPLITYHGRLLALPGEERFWPDPKYLAWHRKKKFLGS